MADLNDPKEPLLEETGEFIWKIITIPLRIIGSVWDVVWPDEDEKLKNK